MRNLLAFFLLLGSLFAYSRNPLPASRFEQLTGKKLSQSTRAMWDNIYNRSQFVYGKAPSAFLSQNYHYIPVGSKVLDIGMGEGRNAVFLAKKGYKVTGVDISKIAIKKAQLLAKEFGVKIKSVTADLKSYEFPEASFDSIICFYFVDRDLIAKLLRWLKPGGILVYEGNTIQQRQLDGKNAEKESYYLKKGELFTLFKGYQILKFEEPIHLDQYRASIIIKNP